MKVLLVSRAMVAASYRSRLRELVRRGIDLTVIAPDKWENQKFEPGAVDGYEVIVANAAMGWATFGRWAHHIFYFKGISRVIGREAWDLVHIDDEPFNFATFHASAVCIERKQPFIFSTWQNIMKSYPPPFSFFERRTFANAAGGIPGNEEALAVLRRRGFSGPAIVIPHHGVDMEFFRKRDTNNLRWRLGLSDCFLVGYFGRVIAEKGIQTLIRAFARMPPECTLLIVGSGPFRPELKQIARALGLLNRVRWIPWVPTSELADYMNAVDVLVLPSVTTPTWKEQLGRVLIEGMACETCVVGSDSGEIPNVIGDAGLVFHEGDEGGLAGCLRRLMDDILLRVSLGHRGRERVLEHFSDRRVADQTAAFYRMVCGQSRPQIEEGILRAK